jgi:hypothetical protein
MVNVDFAIGLQKVCKLNLPFFHGDAVNAGSCFQLDEKADIDYIGMSAGCGTCPAIGAA